MRILKGLVFIPLIVVVVIIGVIAFCIMGSLLADTESVTCPEDEFAPPLR